jgi:N-acyl homoserine lactone hydrolase
LSLYKVHPLVVGQAHVGAALDVFWSLTKEQGRVEVPILAFLIEGGPDPILVDTGMRDPRRAETTHRLGPHSASAAQSLEAQLGLHGLELRDIKTTLLTHLHYDHSGGVVLLPESRFVVQRTELMAAAAPMGPAELEIGSRDMFFDRRDVAALVDPLWDRVDLLEGDRTIRPGIECVLYANSHTPGSQCVYVDTAEGRVALVGDMVRKVDLNIGKAIPPGLYYDLESMMRAMVDIRERADLVYPAHDPKVAALGNSYTGPQEDPAG